MALSRAGVRSTSSKGRSRTACPARSSSQGGLAPAHDRERRGRSRL